MQSGDAVRGVVHVIATVLEIGVDHLRDVTMVFDEENAAAAGAVHELIRVPFYASINATSQWVPCDNGVKAPNR
jgi:hypothetical protein